jgi:galactose mutarotase-like enzyme
MSQIIHLENDLNQVQISTFGAQVLFWKTLLNGVWTDILYTGSSSKRSGIPILFPFANPLKNDTFVLTGAKIPQHGFARNTKWNLIESTTDKAILKLSFKDLDQADQSVFPFPFDLHLEIQLNPDKSIDYTLILKNISVNSLPIAPGIHPYFSINHADKIKLEIAEIPEFKAMDFPWNSKLSGDFYDFKGLASISFPDYILNIKEIGPNPDCKYLVVWSQNESEIDHDFVCFEPFYRETNAINSNPILVKPNETWISKFRFSVR